MKIKTKRQYVLEIPENEAKAMVKEIDHVFSKLLEQTEATPVELQMVCRNLIGLWMELGKLTETTNRELEDSVVRPASKKATN